MSGLFNATKSVNIAMTETKILDELMQKLSSLIPADLGLLKKDLENNIRALLQASLQKLDLVTKEEFDVQSELLARTREKLDLLEQKLAKFKQM